MSHHRKRERSLVIRHLETMTIREQEGKSTTQTHTQHVLLLYTCTQSVDSGTQKHKPQLRQFGNSQVISCLLSNQSSLHFSPDGQLSKRDISFTDHMITDCCYSRFIRNLNHLHVTVWKMNHLVMTEEE